MGNVCAKVNEKWNLFYVAYLFLLYAHAGYDIFSPSSIYLFPCNCATSVVSCPAIGTVRATLSTLRACASMLSEHRQTL